MTATANPSKKGLLNFLKGPDPWRLLLKIMMSPIYFTISLIYSITANLKKKKTIIQYTWGKVNVHWFFLVCSIMACFRSTCVIFWKVNHQQVSQIKEGVWGEIALKFMKATDLRSSVLWGWSVWLSREKNETMQAFPRCLLPHSWSGRAVSLWAQGSREPICPQRSTVTSIDLRQHHPSVPLSDRTRPGDLTDQGHGMQVRDIWLKESNGGWNLAQVSLVSQESTGLCLPRGCILF